jgi:hypothetical protein
MMLIIIWKQFNIFQYIEKLHKFDLPSAFKVFLFTAARQRRKRKWRFHNKRRSVFCDSRSQNPSSLCNVSFANNFKVIHHVRQIFFGGVDSSMRKGAFARGEIQDGQECQRKIWIELDNLMHGAHLNRGSRELSIPHTTLESHAQTIGYESLQASVTAGPNTSGENEQV